MKMEKKRGRSTSIDIKVFVPFFGFEPQPAFSLKHSTSRKVMIEGSMAAQAAKGSWSFFPSGWRRR